MSLAEPETPLAFNVRNSVRENVPRTAAASSPLGYLANAIPKLVWKDLQQFVHGTAEPDTDVKTLVARAELLLAWCEKFERPNE